MLFLCPQFSHSNFSGSKVSTSASLESSPSLAISSELEVGFPQSGNISSYALVSSITIISGSKVPPSTDNGFGGDFGVSTCSPTGMRSEGSRRSNGSELDEAPGVVPSCQFFSKELCRQQLHKSLSHQVHALVSGMLCVLVGYRRRFPEEENLRRIWLRGLPPRLTMKSLRSEI